MAYKKCPLKSTIKRLDIFEKKNKNDYSLEYYVCYTIKAL